MNLLKRAVAALYFCAVFTFWACSSPSLADRMNGLAEYCVSMDSFTDEDLAAVEDDYNMLLEEFRANINDIPSEDRQQIMTDISRINGVLAREAAARSVGIAADGLHALPDIIGGFASGLGLGKIIENLEGLQDMDLEGVLNDILGGTGSNSGRGIPLDDFASDDDEASDLDYDEYDF